MKKLMAWTAAGLLSQGASALTGNTLLSLMQSRDAAANFAASLYVVGFSDGVAGAEAMETMASGSGRRRVFCEPPGASDQQAVDIVKKFIIENPSDRHLDAATLTALALGEAWPCHAK